MKILVVDDEISILKIVTVVLSSIGFTVLTASNLAEARNLLDDCDIVLTDINIGMENGLEFVGEIDKPAFVMSGDYSNSDDETALKLTGHRIIRKPFTFDDLLHNFAPIYENNE
jgi:two-component system response regulator PilR (NtrC family)